MNFMEVIGTLTLILIIVASIGIIIFLFNTIEKMIREGVFKVIDDWYFAIRQNFKMKGVKRLRTSQQPYIEGQEFTCREPKEFEYKKLKYLRKPNFFRRGEIIAWDIDVKPDYWVIVQTKDRKFKPVQYREIDPENDKFVAGFKTERDANMHIEMAAKMLDPEMLNQLKQEENYDFNTND